jgi:hypothetical protein
MEVKAMASGKKIFGIASLILGVLIVTVGIVSAQEAQGKKEELAPAKPTNEFEGVVKIGLGKYFYLPSAQGLDIAVEGKIGSGDASALTGKDVRVKGEMLADKPSIFRADSIEVKEGGSYRAAFTRTADLVLTDYLDTATRDSYADLKITSALKNEEWEGKGKGKVYGKLETSGSTAYILLTDSKNKEIGKIIVDKFTDYASYYVKKLRLFNDFWFYLNVKGTVDKKDRAKTRELFHADVVLSGLY